MKRPMKVELSPARQHVVDVLGFDPGEASPTTRYGVTYLERLGLGWVGRYQWGPPQLLCLAGRACSYRTDAWAAAVVLASLAVDHPKARHQDQTPLLAAATLVLASGRAEEHRP